MHRNPKPMTHWTPGSEEISGDTDIDILTAKGMESLKRDMTHIMRESALAKLSAGSSRDLVAYLRFLKEYKIEESKLANEMTEEELKKLTGET